MTRRHHSDPIPLVGLDAYLTREEPDRGEPPPEHKFRPRNTGPWGEPLPAGAVAWRCNCGALIVGTPDDADDEMDRHLDDGCSR